MNHYGTMAQRHWARWLPQRYATIQDPGSFFSTLGEEVAQQIGDLGLDLAGDDPPGEGYLEKVGRLNMARLQAEEIVLKERILLEPEPGADPDSSDPDGAGDIPPSQPGSAADRGPQPSAVGAGERGAAGTGPGQLGGAAVPAAEPGRPGAVRRGRPGSGRTWPRYPTLRGIQPAAVRRPRMSRRSWPAGRDGVRSRRCSTPHGRSSPGPGRNWPRSWRRRRWPPPPATPSTRTTPTRTWSRQSGRGCVTSVSPGGRVLEPGCGSGNFIAFAPDGAQITGVELDPVTAQIAAALYPDAQIRNESFADTRAA